MIISLHDNNIIHPTPYDEMTLSRRQALEMQRRGQLSEYIIMSHDASETLGVYSMCIHNITLAHQRTDLRIILVVKKRVVMETCAK